MGCATRVVKYRNYPLGKRAAGGVEGHVRSEEGNDVLRRMVGAARMERVAYLAPERDRRQASGLRAVVADALTCMLVDAHVCVKHLSCNSVEAHEVINADAFQARATEILAEGPPKAVENKDAAKATGVRWARNRKVHGGDDLAVESCCDGCV